MAVFPVVEVHASRRNLSGARVPTDAPEGTADEDHLGSMPQRAPLIGRGRLANHAGRVMIPAVVGSEGGAPQRGRLSGRGPRAGNMRAVTKGNVSL